MTASYYVPYEPKDDLLSGGNEDVFFGAKKVVEAEYAYIWKRRCRDPSPDANGHVKRPENLKGLAFSGGGIRSASFCLGVMQALAFKGWLKDIDYLSTVSGGGYIGTSLTWMLHQEWKPPEGNEAIKYGLDQMDFPFATFPMAGVHQQNVNTNMVQYTGRMLRFLRQHARYLTPGDGVNFISLIATILRNSLFNVIIYGVLLVLVFVLFRHLCLFSPVSTWPAPLSFLRHLPDALTRMNGLLFCAVVLSAAFIFISLILYPGATHFFRLKSKSTSEGGTRYVFRRQSEKWLGRFLAAAVIFAILGSLPWTHDAIDKWWGNAIQTNKFTIIGTHSLTESVELRGLTIETAVSKTPNGESIITVILGIGSALAGIVSSIAAFFQTTKVGRVRIPVGVLAGIGSATLLFGILLLTYAIQEQVTGLAVIIWLGIGILVVFLGWATDINYMSLHRYYRDRLMETFLPNVTEALNVNGNILPDTAKRADATPLYQMYPMNAKNRNSDHPFAPYHIINANVVLVSSLIPKFKGRGGDNFIFTPLYCGSNATGWSKTEGRYKDMTLASAMAISGAAVNPNASGNGEGVTRQRLLSLLMGFLNIRLGYWLRNPTPDEERWKRIDAALSRKWTNPSTRRHVHQGKDVLFKFAQGCSRWPNVFFPGLSELVLRNNLDENSQWLQLTDGGHFEGLGLYELIRRKLSLIILCDGTADPDYSFKDLANAVEKVQADFGALIDINCSQLEALSPRKQNACGRETEGAINYSERGYLCAKITYHDDTQGTLLYLNTSFLPELKADLYGYRKSHKDFPEQPTLDQFFDEKQFEAYRELGYKTASLMLREYPKIESFNVEGHPCDKTTRK